MQKLRNYKQQCSIKLKKRKDKWETDVPQRVQQLHDLVATEARYHRQCATSFLRTKKMEEIPTAVFWQRSFKKLCEFHHDECQYLLQVLSDQMAEYLQGHELLNETFQS